MQLYIIPWARGEAGKSAQIQDELVCNSSTKKSQKPTRYKYKQRKYKLRINPAAHPFQSLLDYFKPFRLWMLDPNCFKLFH